jgi:uncharacterized RDD family membrane protein YckC
VAISVATKKGHSATLKKAETSRPAPLRRMLALVYELLPTAAILMLATALVTPLMAEDHVAAGNLWFQLYLLAVLYLYFVWCWSHGGQTLGMRPWRLFVESREHRVLSWRAASIRFAVGLLGWLPLGLGHWWMLFDREGRNWHDFPSNSQVVFSDSDTPAQYHHGDTEQQDTRQ